MFNPLIERHDYGICDQIERQLLELQDKGLLPKEIYNERIDRCREQIIQHRAQQQARQIMLTKKTFRQIQEENPHQQHCLKLSCNCGYVVTCRCKTPKIEIYGICQKCEVL